MFPIRRWLTGDVHDGGPEEILRRHEEDGQEETGESHPTAAGKSRSDPEFNSKLPYLHFSGDPKRSCLESLQTRSST